MVLEALVQFERAMHALVPSVLLGMTGLDALMANAELHPPDGQPREPTRASTRERRPIVGAHALRQAELAEYRFEGWLDTSGLRGPQRLAPQDHSAERIGEYLKGERPMTELCREFGISRKSAYKWVGR